MASMSSNKFLCRVVTKNYPVSIKPSINRYSELKKKLSIGEISKCLASYADVWLIKKNGSTIKLTSNNLYSVLNSYNAELTQQIIDTDKRKESVIYNAKRASQLQEEVNDDIANPTKLSNIKSKISTITKDTTVAQEVKPVTTTTDKSISSDNATAATDTQLDPEDPTVYDSTTFYGIAPDIKL